MRIGFYICHCGINIANTVDIEEVMKFASQLDGVVVAKDYRYMCSDPGQDLIEEDIKSLNLTRVVVAACSPRMHESTFRAACEEAGLNPYLFQMANIREMVSWTTDDKEAGTEKAKRLVAAAIRRVVLHEPLEARRESVAQAVLVVGGGIAGIEASLRLADSGKKVYLVEREPSIGGHMAQLDKTFPTLDCSACILTPKMVEVGSHENIELLAYSEVKDVSGHVGDFRIKITKKPGYVNASKCVGCGVCTEKCPVKVPSEFDMGLGVRKAIYVPFPQAVPLLYTIDRDSCWYFQKGTCRICERFCDVGAVDFDQKEEIIEIQVGAIIVATGYDVFDASKITPLGYGHLDNVITSLEFERIINSSGPSGGEISLKDGTAPTSVAILHCVGSRDENWNRYCSRVCCMYSMKFAHLVRERIPEAKIYELYIDIRAAGKGYEEFYNRVLDEDVTFIRGRGAQVTRLATNSEEEGKLVVVCEDTLLGIPRRIPVDMVILSVGLEPQKDAAGVARMFKLSCSDEGFFLEKHPKLAPVATATPGLYLAGACQGPKDIPDVVAHASAAAAEAMAMLDRGYVVLEPEKAVISEETCSGCRICLDLCPFDAINFDEEQNIAVVEEVGCDGCGVCVSACPSSAIVLRGYTDEEILAEVEGVLA